jgi:UDP-N-acetylmuramate--alanine ligase
MFAKLQRIHFVGIGGIGQSGIAEVLLTLGYGVSGSDLRSTPVTERLRSLGALIFQGHHAENVHGADVVVASSAIQSSNPEIAEAQRLHLPVIQRAEMLSELMRLKYGIAIAGMHGKTTTTSMVAAVLGAGGLDPTVVVGGRVDAMGSNARLGTSQYLVAEADESDRSFLKLSPIISVVTNIDREHLDCYADLDDIEKTFIEFMDRVPFYGTVVCCNDNDLLRGILPQVRRRVVTYGSREGSDFLLREHGSRQRDGRLVSYFNIEYKGESLGEFEIHVPGLHNILDATAAVAVGMGLEIPVEKIREGLLQFRGVDRRFQLKGEVAGVRVIDDYGHHPTEIAATLKAARQYAPEARLHVIFQPHRYSRTYLLADQFAEAFVEAANVFVLEIYAASEQPIAGVNALWLARKIKTAGGGQAEFASSSEAAIEAAVAAAQPGDVIFTLGAGSVSQLGAKVLEELAKKS